MNKPLQICKQMIAVSTTTLIFEMQIILTMLSI